MRTGLRRHSSDFYTAICVSKELFNISFHYFETLPKGKVRETKFEKNPPDFPKMVAATTTLVLAIELMFKALSLTANGTAADTHDLTRLFKDLPLALKTDIQKIYSSLFNDIPEKAVTKYTFHIAPSHIKPTTEDLNSLDAIPDPKDDVLALLTLERHAFVTWRYLHEKAKPTGVFGILIHFNHLIMLYRAIEQHTVVKSLMQKRT